MNKNENEKRHAKGKCGNSVAKERERERERFLYYKEGMCGEMISSGRNGSEMKYCIVIVWSGVTWEYPTLLCSSLFFALADIQFLSMLFF